MTGASSIACNRGARGEKALYRLLASTKGQFVFIPGMTSPRETIDASTDMLLMKTVRQADELKAVMSQMPSFSAQVALARRPPASISDMGERVVIDELLDAFVESDLEVMRGLKDLLGANALVVLDAGAERTALCDEDEAVALRAAALKLRPLGHEGAARLAVLTGSYIALSRFARALSAIEGFVSEASSPEVAGEGSLGTLGTLRVGGVEVELFALLVDPRAQTAMGRLSRARARRDLARRRGSGRAIARAAARAARGDRAGGGRLGAPPRSGGDLASRSERRHPPASPELVLSPVEFAQ